MLIPMVLIHDSTPVLSEFWAIDFGRIERGAPALRVPVSIVGILGSGPH